MTPVSEKEEGPKDNTGEGDSKIDYLIIFLDSAPWKFRSHVSLSLYRVASSGTKTYIFPTLTQPKVSQSNWRMKIQINEEKIEAKDRRKRRC